MRRGRSRGGLGLTLLLAGVLAATPVLGRPLLLVRYDPAQVAHVRFVAAFEEALQGRRPRTRLVLRPLDAAGTERRPALVVAVGYRALRGALAANAPVLAVLVPRITVEETTRAAGRELAPKGDVTAVYLDQPPLRRLRLVRLALPGVRRLGVLVGPGSRRLLPELRRAAATLGIRLVTEAVEPEDLAPRAAERLLGEVEALLAVPDPVVYNRFTLPGILLSAYHHHVPMFGFSAAYVRAGALAAVHSEPQDLAPQAAALALRSLRRRPPPPPEYPARFRVTVNRHVARSLGILLPPEAELGERLRRLEGRTP